MPVIPCAGNENAEDRADGGYVLNIVIMKMWRRILVMVAAMLVAPYVNAQDVNAALQDANQKVRSYFQTGTQLMYAIGGILAIIGAVKVYQKWNSGDPDTGRVAAAWFGSCVFLVIVVTVVRAFFGI